MTTWTPIKRAISGTGGIVAAQHWRAAEAGAAVLAEGGNAVDAAVTAALTLSVVEPWLSGIGGGGFLVRVDGTTGAADALDYNMVSGAALDPDDYKLVPGEGGDWFAWPAVEGDRNLTGWSSVCVPGAVAGFAAALERYGSISFARALEPAIEEAEHGLRVDWFTALCLAIDAPNLGRDPAAAALFLDDGRPPRLPEVIAEIARPWREKAATLRRLADRGPRDFYEGETMERLARDLEEAGAPVSRTDLAAYEARWVPALEGHYRDMTIHAMSGLSGGPALIDTLERLTPNLSPDGDDPAAHHFAQYAEAIRATYAQRLNRDGHAKEGCTTHVSVMDASGTMVSLTNTLLSRFGAKVVSGRTGLPLNNGMMWFDPRPGTPNAIAAATRPLANMCPIVASRAGRPVLALGAAGGRQIFPAVAQLLSFVADFGMDLERAFHTPRIDASTATIAVNRACPQDTAAAIARTHPVEIVDDTLYPVRFAIPSAVMRSGDGAVGMAHPNHPWAAARAAQ